MNPRSLKSHESQQFPSLIKSRSVESLAQIRKANISSSLPVQWNRHRKLFLGIYAVTFILKIQKSRHVCITPDRCRLDLLTSGAGYVDLHTSWLPGYLGGAAGRALSRVLFYRLEFYRRSRAPQENSPSTPAKEPKLLDQLRHKMRMLHVAKRIEEAYIAWIYRYLCFARDLHGKWIHPNQLSDQDVNASLTHLAVDRNVAAIYQNQALAALLFLYMKFHGTELKLDSVRAKPSHKLSVVLSALEVTTVLRLIPASHQHTISSLL
jgi:hypothetical protein